MTEDGSRGQLVDILNTARYDVLDRYTEALRRSHSPIADRPADLAGATEQASSLLRELAGLIERPNLRPGDVTAAAHAARTLSHGIGEERARAGVHPRASLAAGSQLFSAILQSVRERLPQPAPVDTLIEIATLTNALIAERIGAASDAYSSLLLREIQQANESERVRVSRELHDRIGHDVHLAYRALELFQVSRNDNPVRADQAVQDAYSAIRNTLDCLRNLISGLRLDAPQHSLEKSLRLLCESGLVGDVSISVTVNGDERWAPLEVIGEGYLIIREAIRNALAHAQAVALDVRIDVSPHELRAVVADDGIGFDPDATSAGAGLASMTERVRLLNGGVMITSAAGQGSMVDIVIPLAGQWRHD